MRHKKISKLLAFMLSLIWLLQPGVVPYSLRATEPKYLSAASFFAKTQSLLLDSELESLLNSARGLAFSQQPDAIDPLLLAYSKRKEKPYLRVTVRDPEDLSTLRVAVRLEEGKLKEKTSALKKLIYETGGILYLDYANSDPKLVEEFNSLFDQTPRFEEKEVSKDLLVVGVMERQFFTRYPVSFYSRYAKVIQKELSSEDPLASIAAPPKNYSGDRVNLHSSSQYESILVGKYFFNAEGELQFGVAEGENQSQPEGLLVQAIRQGKPLLIENGPWEQSEKFRHFIRQILIRGGVVVNGSFVPMASGFKLYRQQVDESKNTNPKTTVVPNSEKEVVILNRETVDQLYSLVHIKNKKMIQRPGWIQTPGKPIAIRVTEPLPDEIWHQLFHAPRAVEIQVLNPEWVPSIYRDKIQKGFDQSQEPNKPIEWENLNQYKGVYLQADDLTLLSEKIKRDFKKQIQIFPITPETALSDFTGSLEVSGSKASSVGHNFFLTLPKNGVMNALKKGETVVLEGMDRNPTLLKQLQSVLIEKPYWIVNGEKIFLSQYRGKLILTGKTMLPKEFWGARYWQQEKAEADQELQKISPEILTQLFKLRDLYQAMPLPVKQRVVPRRFELNFEKLTLLFRYSQEAKIDLVSAFEKIFLAPYVNDLERIAYMRVQLKKSLRTAKQKEKSLDANKVKALMRQGLTTEQMRKNYWQWIDTLSLDLIQELELPSFDVYSVPTPPKEIQKIQAAIVAQQTGEKQKALSEFFDLPSDFSSDWTMDSETAPFTPNWEEQKKEALFILKNYQMVFLKGEPGVGKSYISDALGQELGYSSEDKEIYTLVTGANTQEADILSKHQYDEATKKSHQVPQVIEAWARHPKGALLLWDEANLVSENFLQFLSGVTAEHPYIWIRGEKIVLTPRHRIIFTGNPETFQGRKFQNLIEEKVITVNFYPFSDAELKELILKQNYLQREYANKNELVDLMIELHRFFEKVRPNLGFSLRDIQELASRIEILALDWDKTKVIQIAWDLYSGYFDREEEVMAKALLEQKQGVTLSVILNPPQWGKEGHRIGWTQESLQLVRRVSNFLEVRKARILSKSKTQYRGKWALLFEGPSGLGKDALTEKTLEAHGLKCDVDYFIWNASPYKIEDLKKLINKVAQEGKILIVSEINLVSSAILEGMLNTLLTEQGDFTPGFALIGTMNSVDFQGRETFSSAFKNRMAYYRVYDYSQQGLSQVARSQFLEKEWEKIKEQVQTIVGAHVWIRDHVGGPHQSPTLREFLRAMKLIQKGEPSQHIIEEIYGPIYLQTILADKKLPAMASLAQYQENDPIDWAKVYSLAASFFLGEKEGIKIAQKLQNKRPLPEKVQRSQIELSKIGSPESWQELMEGLGGYLFHERKSPWKPSAETKPLYLLLENYRILASLKKAGLIQKVELYDGEKRVIEAIQANDFAYLENLSDQELFGSLLLLAALGKLDSDSKSYIEEVLEKKALIADLDKALPFAKTYLKSTALVNVITAQYRAFRQFKKIRGIWKNLSSEKPTHFVPKPAPASSAQTLDTKRAQKTIEQQKEERKNAKIKELKEKISTVEQKLAEPFLLISKYKIKSIKNQFPQLEQDTQRYKLREKTLLKKLSKRLAAIVEAENLNLEMEQIAEQAAFPKEDIEVCFQKTQMLCRQILKLVKKKNLLDGEKHSLMRKGQALLEGVGQLRHRELFETDANGGLAGKAYAEQYFGKGFFQNLNPKGSTGKGGISADEDLNTDYEEGEKNVYENSQYFEPHLFRYARLRVKELDYQEGKIIVKENEKQNLQPVPFEAGTQAEWESKGFVVFHSMISKTFTRGETKSIASVSPDQHLFNHALPDGISLYKDSLGLYYAKSDRDYPQTVKLKFSVAVPKTYFGVAIPDMLSLPSSQKILRKKLDPDLLLALQQFGLEPEETNIKKILIVLASTLKQFKPDRIPEEKRTGNQFLDTILHRSGAACRHRARIFVILAQALGMKVQMATSTPHAFPEVFIPSQGTFDGGWMQIRDLGGAPGEIRNKMPEFNLKERVSFSKPEKIETRERKPAKSEKEARFIPQETVERSSLIQQLTNENRNRLKTILKNLFFEALASEQQQQASEMGSHFSVTRFIEDPSRPFVTALPQIQLFPKQILLTNPFEKWNPLLEELIFFLFEEGVKVFVYEGERYEPTLVRTLSELKEQLKSAPQVSAEEIKQFIQSERNPLTTVSLDLNHLLNQAKQPYLAELFYQSISEEKSVANAKEPQTNQASFQWLEDFVVDNTLTIIEEPEIEGTTPATKRKEKAEKLLQAARKAGNITGEVLAVDIDEQKSVIHYLFKIPSFFVGTLPFSSKNSDNFEFDIANQTYKKIIDKIMIDALKKYSEEPFKEIQIKVIDGQLMFACYWIDSPEGYFVSVFKFNLENSKVLFRKALHSERPIEHFSFSPDGQHLAVAYDGNDHVQFYRLGDFTATPVFATSELKGQPTAIHFDVKNQALQIETLGTDLDFFSLSYLKELSEEEIYAKIEDRLSFEVTEHYFDLTDKMSTKKERKEFLLDSYETYCLAQEKVLKQAAKWLYTWKAPTKNEPGTLDWLLSEKWKNKEIEPVEVEEQVHPIEREPISADGKLWVKLRDVKKGSAVMSVFEVLDSRGNVLFSYQNHALSTLFKAAATNDGKIFAYANDNEIYFNSPEGRCQFFHVWNDKILDFVLDPMGRYLIYLIKNDETEKVSLEGKLLSQDKQGNFKDGETVELLDPIFIAKHLFPMIPRYLLVSSDGDFLFLHRESGWEARMVFTTPTAFYLEKSCFEKAKYIFALPNGIGLVTQDEMHLYEKTKEPGSLLPFRKIKLFSDHLFNRVNAVALSSDQKIAVIASGGVLDFVSLGNEEKQPFLHYAFENIVDNISFEPDGSQLNVYLADNKIIRFSREQVEIAQALKNLSTSFLFDIASKEEILAAIQDELVHHPSKKEKMERCLEALRKREPEAISELKMGMMPDFEDQVHEVKKIGHFQKQLLDRGSILTELSL